MPSAYCTQHGTARWQASTTSHHEAYRPTGLLLLQLPSSGWKQSYVSSSQFMCQTKSWCCAGSILQVRTSSIAAANDPCRNVGSCRTISKSSLPTCSAVRPASKPQARPSALCAHMCAGCCRCTVTDRLAGSVIVGAGQARAVKLQANTYLLSGAAVLLAQSLLYAGSKWPASLPSGRLQAWGERHAALAATCLLRHTACTKPMHDQSTGNTAGCSSRQPCAAATSGQQVPVSHVLQPHRVTS